MPRGPYRLPWATLLRRVFAIAVLTCDRCGDKRRLVALIDKDAAIQKILAHLVYRLNRPLRGPIDCSMGTTKIELDTLTRDGVHFGFDVTVRFQPQCSDASVPRLLTTLIPDAPLRFFTPTRDPRATPSGS